MIKPIALCSQCLKHEISSWITKKSGMLDAETLSNVYLELRDIKLTQGECIVCFNKMISDDCFFRILKVLNKHKVSEEIKQEFIRMFGFKA